VRGPRAPQQLRVGGLRPNQLLHTYGIGAMADLPNLSVVMAGLDQWESQHARTVVETRLLDAVRSKLGRQVESLRIPPHLQETPDPFAEWARVGVPVRLFPGWLRCSNSRCNRLGRANSGIFERLEDSASPDRTRYVHNCWGRGNNRPTAVPARFVLACASGHLDDFPWLYFVHPGAESAPGHSLRMAEHGSTGEAADVTVSCDGCDQPHNKVMALAFGGSAEQHLPACRGRHPHLGTFETCTSQVRTLVLGATNSWFPMQLRAFTLPRDREPIDYLVAHYWEQLADFHALPSDAAKRILPNQFFWPDLETHGVDKEDYAKPGKAQQDKLFLK
jgi:hypothetical protein